MKWTDKQIKRLKELCYQGVSNKELAKTFKCDIKDIYSKRSQLGITIAECGQGFTKQESLAEFRDALNKAFEEKERKSDFTAELKKLINNQSMENESDTPDFILAEYLKGCLEAFEHATNQRDKWHGFQAFGKTEGQ